MPGESALDLRTPSTTLPCRFLQFCRAVIFADA
jgi:hypothetical protein